MTFAVPFSHQSTILVTAAAATATTALPTAPGKSLVVQNTGSSVAYYQLGISTVTSAVPTSTASANFTILPGQSHLVTRSPDLHTHVAYISPNGTTLTFSVGEGN